MYKTFLQIWIFILCVNGMVIVANALIDQSSNPNIPDDSIGTPFDISTDLDPCADPTNAICLGQSTLATNSTLQQNWNSTNTLSASGWVGDFAYAGNVVWDFIGALTGSSVFGALEMFGFPPIFVYMCQSIMGVFMAITIVHYVFNR